MKKSNFFGGAAIGAALAGVADWLFFKRQWGAEADTLRSELNISRRQQQDLQNRIVSGSAEVQGKLTASEARTGELEAKLASLEGDNQALQKQVSSSKGTHTRKLKAASAEIEQLKAQLSQAETKAANAMAAADAANASLAASSASTSTTGSSSSAPRLAAVSAEVVSSDFDEVIEEVIVEDVVVEEVAIESSDSAEMTRQPEGGISDTKPVSNDDLRKIIGIGSKISTVLYMRGVTSFAQMAEMSADELRAILKSASIGRVSDPTTWPQQAKVAATGDWDALYALQDTIKNGKII